MNIWWPFFFENLQQFQNFDFLLSQDYRSRRQSDQCYILATNVCVPGMKYKIRPEKDSTDQSTSGCSLSSRHSVDSFAQTYYSTDDSSSSRSSKMDLSSDFSSSNISRFYSSSRTMSSTTVSLQPDGSVKFTPLEAVYDRSRPKSSFLLHVPKRTQPSKERFGNSSGAIQQKKPMFVISPKLLIQNLTN